MRVCIVHNEYGRLSGEEIMVSSIVKLLHKHGHEVHCYFRGSQEINNSPSRKVKAFFSGIYSLSSRKQMRKIIEEYRPDVVQVQNVYPLISPSILIEAGKHKIPVVMRCANYRLACPNGLFMTKGQICEKCSGGREWWCFLKNCERNYFKSLGYALRNYVARKKKYFRNNVTFYYAQTEFQKQKLIAEGYPATRIVVIPNMVKDTCVHHINNSGDFVGYVGRVSPEKGISTLIEATAMCPDVLFKAAGNYDRMPELIVQTPDNFEFLGSIQSKKLGDFYALSRFIVLPSICFEGFPSVLLESMIQSKPVIASRTGGLPEIVEDGVTGLLFEPGNAKDLSEKIRYLWGRPELCRKMGQTGREKALREYSPEKYYERLMAVYEKAVELGPGGRNSGY